MRIVGGRRVEPHSYPWTVAIMNNGRMHCGGALITTRHILSAGHCFKWYVSSVLVILLLFSRFFLNKLSDETTIIVQRSPLFVSLENKLKIYKAVTIFVTFFLLNGPVLRFQCNVFFITGSNMYIWIIIQLASYSYSEIHEIDFRMALNGNLFILTENRKTRIRFSFLY